MSTALLDACDKYGMLVMDELFDCWRAKKNPGDYHLYFEHCWKEDTASVILRDRNHPSVVMYSIGNEIGERDGSGHGAQNPMIWQLMFEHWTIPARSQMVYV